jgi:hypothetical protein
MGIPPNVRHKYTPQYFVVVVDKLQHSTVNNIIPSIRLLFDHVDWRSLYTACCHAMGKPFATTTSHRQPCFQEPATPSTVISAW